MCFGNSGPGVMKGSGPRRMPNRFLCWEQQALSEVPHKGTFHWHITASRVLQGPVVLCWLEMLSIYVMGQSAQSSCLSLYWRDNRSELCQVQSLSNYAIMTSKLLSYHGQEMWEYTLLPDQSSLAVFNDVHIDSASAIVSQHLSS